MDAENTFVKFMDSLRQILPGNFAEEQLGQPMLDLGVNSFMVIEIMVKLEQAFNINFPDSLINPGLFASPQTLYEGMAALVSTNEDI